MRVRVVFLDAALAAHMATALSRAVALSSIPSSGAWREFRALALPLTTVRITDSVAVSFVDKRTKHKQIDEVMMTMMIGDHGYGDDGEE